MIRKLQLMVVILAVGTGMVLFSFVREQNPYGVAADAAIVQGERYIVVLIPSYNNIRWHEMNLKTVLDQEYQNYHIIYIDDCSTDGTAHAVQNYVEQSGKQHRVTLIKNQSRQGALSNLYHAIHACPDRAIIVTIDGDDWLARTDVLSILNRAYANPHVLMTYGQYETFPGKALGTNHPLSASVVQEGSYRMQQDWCTTHLRTFYAGLFKRIKKEDLMLDGNFFSMTWDRAFMYPMLEMANGRYACIDTVLYVYNQVNPLNDFRTNVRYQEYCCRLIQSKQPYKPLSAEQAALFYRS